MARLEWDNVGERFYQGGVDRGVLFLPTGGAVPWNGIIGVSDSPKVEKREFFLDGVKYLEIVSPNDFNGKLRAFTYPDEFESIMGIAAISPGLDLHDQPSKSFGLSYRTRVGNDLDGYEYGYKIHLLYNLTAVPEEKSFDSLGDSSVQPIEFIWNLSGVPDRHNGFRPTTHVTIDSRKTPRKVLKKVELKIYGSRWVDPVLLPISELVDIYIPPEVEP